MSDPGVKLAAAVSGRVDAMEVSLDQHTRDIAALRKDGESLTKTVKSILKREEEGEGQPDWLLISSPQDAVDTLLAAMDWHDRLLPYLNAAMPTCWPWHPILVCEVLALAETREAAYLGGDPVKVSDFMARHLMTFRSRNAAETKQCNRSEHVVGEETYTVDRGQLDTYARWWATDRRGVAPGLRLKVMAA